MPESQAYSFVIPAHAGIPPSDMYEIPGHARDDRERGPSLIFKMTQDTDLKYLDLYRAMDLPSRVEHCLELEIRIEISM
jgi:hypothetical protein